jgi:hypothetical protein
LKSRIKFAFVAAVAGAVVMFAGSASRADFELELSTSSGADIKLVDSTNSGKLTFDASIGSFVVTVSTALSKPIIGSASNPAMDLSFVVVSSGTDTLTIKATDTGFNPVPTAGWSATLGGTSNLAGNSSISYQAFASSGSTEFDMSGNSSRLMKETSSTFQDSSGISPNGITAPYTLTQEVVIAAGGSGFASGDATLTTPEPATLAMVAAGIPMFGFAWAGRRMLKRA